MFPALVALFAASAIASPLDEDFSEDALMEEFYSYDGNHDGVLDGMDFRAKFNRGVDSVLLFSFFGESDKDESGTITIEEFVEARKKRMINRT